MKRRLSPPIVFMHIPKAGGTTVREQLRAWLPAARHVQFTSAHACDEISDEELARTDVLTGHIGFRFLRRVPDARIVTFLRDPFERVRSQYYYHKHNLRTFQGRPLSFSEYLRSDVPGFRAVLAHGIVWQFAWDHYSCHRDVQRFPHARGLLQAAYRNIRRVDFIGFQEELDADLRSLGMYLGVEDRRPVVPAANVTREKPRSVEISEADREVFERRAALDIAFVAEVKMLVQQRRAADWCLPGIM